VGIEGWAPRIAGWAPSLQLPGEAGTNMQPAQYTVYECANVQDLPARYLSCHSLVDNSVHTGGVWLKGWTEQATHGPGPNPVRREVLLNVKNDLGCATGRIEAAWTWSWGVGQRCEQSS